MNTSMLAKNWGFLKISEVLTLAFLKWLFDKLGDYRFKTLHTALFTDDQCDFFLIYILHYS